MRQERDVVRFAFREDHLAAVRKVSWRGGRPDAGGAGGRPEKVRLEPEWGYGQRCSFSFHFYLFIFIGA